MVKNDLIPFMFYLLLGNDQQIKDKFIEKIKKDILPSADSFYFDYNVLHAPQTNSVDLKKILLSLPAIASKRIVVIRDIRILPALPRSVILDFLKKKNNSVVLILDSSEEGLTNNFLKEISLSCQLIQGQAPIKVNVFDIMDAIFKKEPQQALKVLSLLLEDGAHPLQMMGAFVWGWQSKTRKLSKQVYYRGLHILKEADYNIKRSRLSADMALEVAIMKLSFLLI